MLYIPENDASLDNLNFLTPEDYVKQEIKEYSKVAENFGGLGAVYVGAIIGRRECLKELCLYSTITFSVRSDSFSGVQQIEGHFKCASLTELAALGKLCNLGKTLVIDKGTKEIIEVKTW